MNQLQMKLLFLKKSLNLTNEDLATKAGLPVATVSRIISGKTLDPKADTLRKLAMALDCKVDELLGTNQNVEPYYFDKETAEIAQEVAGNQDLKILLHSCKDLPTEQIKTFQNMINMLKNK